MKPKGYLVFTTHSGEEINATFVPEDEVGILADLRNFDLDDKDILHRWSEWRERDDLVEWRSPREAFEEWPFNDFLILGTFHLSVY